MKDNNKYPKVSVIIPTYNRANLLQGTIKSVLDQTIQDFEVLVVDDNSTDNTKEIILNINDERVKYIRHNKNLGGAAARNTGISNSSGVYVAFLDSDDKWLPDHLEQKINSLKKNNAEGVYGNFYLKKNNERIKGNITPKTKRQTMAEYVISSSGDTRTTTFVFKREPLLKIMFDENLQKHQDWDLAIRFDEEFNFIYDSARTVVLNIDNPDRMSNNINHDATSNFLEKHQDLIRDYSLAKYYLKLALYTLKEEGRNINYKHYMNRAKKFIKPTDITLILYSVALSLPLVNYKKLHNIYKKVSKMIK